MTWHLQGDKPYADRMITLFNDIYVVLNLQGNGSSCVAGNNYTNGDHEYL